MKKKFVFLLIFILIILINLNSYAFTDDFDFDYNVINEKLGTNFEVSFMDTLLPTIKNTTNYYNFYKSCNNVVLMYDTVLNANRKHTLYIIFTPIKDISIYSQNDFLFNNSSNYLYFMRCTFNINDDFTINNASISQPSTTLQSNNLINYKTISSSYYYDDITSGSIFYHDNIFYNNSFIGIQEEGEGSSVDMTETNNLLTENFGIIKAFLFLICLYLLCKAIYGVIWWLYNKVLL